MAFTPPWTSLEDSTRTSAPYNWEHPKLLFTGPAADSIYEYFYRKESHELWYEEIHYVRALPQRISSSTKQLLADILCVALRIQHDCERNSVWGSHDLLFFTNFRTIQIYCFHDSEEEELLQALIHEDGRFRKYQVAGEYGEKNYLDYTEGSFRSVRGLLVWECIFPEGIDMDALSPRDANAHIRLKQHQAEQKAKVVPAKSTSKEKDHPPPPPDEVQEPSSSDRKHGASYQTGKCLGKGGFAICYEGRLKGTKQMFALKIVKSHMPQKKMEQKFQTELQIHSKMKHPNIVQFHRAFSFQQCTYIVLELCPNGSLMDMVKKRKFVTEPEVRFWTVQMAGAIKYMHSKGVIHRDLKMGNIFLDKDMNVKVGDFGLAALLMTGKDMAACRRTTLCGTPNYIAPEILEKGKGGHDHAVDIWSLGIIIFAMLTGKPPFQSTTADEIYRRAREREYDWPKLNTSENFISDETKDLVSMLLQGPDKRPDPDTIVQHPFFKCGWMPQAEEMTVSLRDEGPTPTQFLSVGVRAGRTNLYSKNLKKLCIKCNVGPWNQPPKLTSTYREVAAEEKAGLTPMVPLPEDVVYRPYDEWLKEQADNRNVKNAEDDRSEDQSRVTEDVPLMRKPPVQSFAAQQRARPQASDQLSRSGSSRQPSSEVSRPKTSTESGSRPVVNISARNGRFRKVEPRVLPEVEDRLAADLADQLNKAEAERKSQETRVNKNITASIFSPTEEKRVQQLPGTEPDKVLEGLHRLLAGVEKALGARTMAYQTSKPDPPSPKVVVKWVDYTNKYGLGYILNNGNIGCIFKALPASDTDPSSGYVPPSCLLIRDAERHIQNRDNEGYMDRNQLIPVSGPAVEFFENRGKQGFYRGKVSPRNYRVPVSPGGEIGKLLAAEDEWDARKKEKLLLWKKFSNYMTAYGRDQDYPYDEAVARRAEGVSEGGMDGNVITFYQRFGDVGIWGYCGGSLQFNFPDHTKVVISADGTWCDFFHLPLEAARDLAQKGTIPSTALDDRQHLSFPLQTLLNFMSKPSKTARKRPEIDPMIQGIPQANDFRKKVEFIRIVVKEWTTNGGIGISNMEPEGRLRWTGYRELINVKIPYKHVWVTVGAKNGDDRRVAWFDPREPQKIIPDIQ